ncbi:hypothetical protein RHMOL_Rhmol08G0261400 [Rhododendron molle]|uniref:Uncharacterized protein n=1 Tax=Rhododendron molle TaxID=49168 RepID=A0ACC0MUL7_RHOML|nr:hypothetical protein RHMOL_Rhmol08G0261400 [Rhododendron molle]
MRGVGKSSGRPSLTESSEVRDIVSVCKWVAQNFSVRRILLVGSSAGTCKTKKREMGPCKTRERERERDANMCRESERGLQG